MALYPNEITAARMLYAANPTAGHLVAAKIRNCAQPLVLLDEVAADPGAIAALDELLNLADYLAGKP
jgi:hypothetical protein